MEDAFVYYYCISDRFKDTLIYNSSSTTLPIINKKKMSALEFIVPPKSEQAKIVRILDNLFAKEQQAKEAAEAVLEKIDLLKKSSLARAFRGELGTNDPTEESALELLKKVLDIPTEPKAPVKRTFIPKDLENQIKTELERKIIKLYIQGDTDIIPISQMMSVSSKKFELMDTLRSLQQRGILVKEDEAYKLLR
jgi:type I restriction enzyme S subunit